MGATPAYLRVADDLRRQIVEGSLPPGARVPSRAELTARYGCSDSVVTQAVRLLAAEGFVEGRSGSGTYVRQRPQTRRLTRSWYREQRGTSPFRAEMETHSRAGSWESHSERTTPPPDVAERLAISSDDAVMRTRYAFLADGEPAMLSTSWEPFALTRGTPITLPEEGPHAGNGVVVRMAAIDVAITHAVEDVTARPALAAEADQLGTLVGAAVIVIERTYYAEDQPVETADIVIPADRYRVSYMLPVSDGPGPAGERLRG